MSDIGDDVGVSGTSGYTIMVSRGCIKFGWLVSHDGLMSVGVSIMTACGRLACQPSWLYVSWRVNHDCLWSVGLSAIMPRLYVSWRLNHDGFLSVGFSAMMALCRLTCQP
jgi:hypothetical protein